MDRPHSFALCDRAEHVERARRECPDVRILALTPRVAWFCETQRIPFVTLDDFISPGAMNEFAERHLRRQYEWAAFVDRRLRCLLPEFDDLGFDVARLHLYWLKRFADAFVLPARSLLEFDRAAQTERLLGFERAPFVPDMGAPGRQRPIHSWLAPVLFGADRVRLLGDSPSGTSRPTLGLPQLGRIRRSITTRTARAFARIQGLGKTRVAWIGARAYGSEHIVSALKLQHVNPLQPPRSLSGRSVERGLQRSFRVKLAGVSGALLDSEDFWVVTDAVSSALRPLARPAFERWLLQDVPLAWAQFKAAREWLSTRRIKATFGIEVQDPATAAMYAAAGSLGIPRVAMIHQGGMIQDLPIHDTHGPIQADTYLVNGPGDVDYFEALGKTLNVFSRATNVPIGSPRLEALRRPRQIDVDRLRRELQGGDDRPIVLYVPTIMYGCHRYFGEGYTSDISYFKLQMRVLRRCAEFPDIRILYKPLGGFEDDPIQDFLAASVPNATVIGGTLTQLMWSVDAVVIDFSATAVTEAVATDRELVVHAGRDWARMDPDATTLLRRRAAVSETPDAFERDVVSLLSEKRFGVRKASPEFAYRYTTFLNDGKAAVRGADIVAAAAHSNSGTHVSHGRTTAGSH